MTEEKGERTTWGLLLCWLMNKSSSSVRCSTFSSGWKNNFQL